jgi:5-methylcytosine-specific restriction protein A
MANKIARVCWFPLCGRINCTVHGTRPVRARQMRKQQSSAQQGYGYHWQQIRARFLANHPTCESCGRIATVADHVPTRKELVRQGVDNPDDEKFLHALCASCHARKTVKEDGGWRRKR